MASAPWLVKVYTLGFTGEQRVLAVVFSRFFLPHFLFHGPSAPPPAPCSTSGPVRRPDVGAAGQQPDRDRRRPGYLVIGAAISIASPITTYLLLLAVGTIAGVFAQMALVVWALARSGFALRPGPTPAASASAVSAGSVAGY